LANNALAIRIIFPSVRVIQVSFNLTGLPASLGKQKRQRELPGAMMFAMRSGWSRCACTDVNKGQWQVSGDVPAFFQRVKNAG